MYRVCILSPLLEKEVLQLKKYQVLDHFDIYCCQNKETLLQQLESIDFHILLIDSSFGEDFLISLVPILEGYSSLKIILATSREESIPIEYGKLSVRYLYKDSLEYGRGVLLSVWKELDEQYYRLPINADHKIEFIVKDDIYYIESAKNYVYIYTVDKTYKVRKTLGEIHRHLNRFFYPVVKGVIVNVKWIKEIDKKERTIKMEDDRIFSVSRSNSTIFSLFTK